MPRGCFPVIISLLVLLLSTCPSKGEDMKGQCRKTYQIDRSHSPWQNYTRDSQQEQAGRNITAVKMTSEFAPIPHLASYTLDDQPLLADDVKNQRVVINEAFFSPISRPDATALRAGERMVIGKALDARLRENPGLLVSFLLESQLIQTYHHLEATLTLRQENDTARAFSAVFDGIHVYFTNDENRDAFTFRLLLDKQNGEITVEGE